MSEAHYAVRKQQHRMVVLKRFGAAMVDWSIEFSGGLLGSYFGVMIAALLVAFKDEPPESMEQSMWNGLGFGFVFWTLSVSFINRVLVQGLSRASIGKKIFKLEMISTGDAITWTTMIKRWMLSHVSLAMGGAGYVYMIIDSEGRAFHDIVMKTDVIPLFQSGVMTIEHHEEFGRAPLPVLTTEALSRILVLPNTNAERPMATLIHLPLKSLETAPAASVQPSLAEVVQLVPKEQDEKKKAA